MSYIKSGVTEDDPTLDEPTEDDSNDEELSDTQSVVWDEDDYDESIRDSEESILPDTQPLVIDETDLNIAMASCNESNVIFDERKMMRKTLQSRMNVLLLVTVS